MEDSLDDEKNAYLLYTSLISSIGAIILAANLTVVVSAFIELKKGKETKPPYILQGSVALANAFLGITLIYGQIFPKTLRQQNVCAAHIGITLSAILISIYSIGLLSLDRFLFLISGLYYQRWFSSIRATCSVLLVWIAGCAIGFLPLMGWSAEMGEKEICSIVVKTPKILVLMIFVLSVLPTIIVSLLYSTLIHYAFKKITKISVMGVNASQQMKTHRIAKPKNIQNSLEFEGSTGFMTKIFKKKISKSVGTSKRWKALKLSFFTTLGFSFTWLPYLFVSYHYMQICEDSKNKRCRSLKLVLESPLTILAFVNCFLDPIIYAWWHKGFNKFVKRRISTFRLKDINHDRRVLPNANSNIRMLNANENVISV